MLDVIKIKCESHAMNLPRQQAGGISKSLLRLKMIFKKTKKPIDSPLDFAFSIAPFSLQP